MLQSHEYAMDYLNSQIKKIVFKTLLYVWFAWYLKLLSNVKKNLSFPFG